MPNSISSTGLTVKTRAEIIAEILNGTANYPGLYSIYGPNINVDPNSPDGQLINLVAQVAVDTEEFLQQIYNSFDPDQAIGINLDLRCAINGITRMPGTKTTVYVTINSDRTVVLPGLWANTGTVDLPPNPDAFRVRDSAGNVYAMQYDHTFVGVDTDDRIFISDQIGPLAATANTLTIIATPTLGITSVNNASSAYVVGTTEETDYTLRIRRANSVSMPSKGYLQGLWAAITAITGVTSVLIKENPTSGVVDTIPSHSIRVIAQGGDDADIGQAIYVHRNAGCGMVGATTVAITQVDGTVFDVAFDRPTAENLYIKLTLTAITGTVDSVYVKTQLLAQLTYQINQQADASAISELVKTIAPNASISDCKVSGNGSTWVDLLATTSFYYQWATDPARTTVSP